jgi:nucleotide-binding universal stress UspA family protein
MKQFQKILAIFDTEERDTTALKLAHQLAGESGGQLTAVHVIPPLPSEIPEGIGGLDELKQTLVRAAESTLEAALGKLTEGKTRTRMRVCWGHTAMEVSRLVMTEGHDLVVKGTGRRKRFPGKLLGSVDMRLLRKCPCPVWLIKPEGHDYVTNILAAIDPVSSDVEEERLNELILRLGISLAEAEEADFHVLYAFSPWGESLLRSRLRSDEYLEYVKQMRTRGAKSLNDLMRNFEDEVPEVNRHLIEGSPEEVVPEFVRTRGVDVVVMGTVGRTGVPGFLIGNTAEKILADVDCSVLAVKPAGFRSPVEAE